MAGRVLPQIDVGKPLCRRTALGRDRFAVGAHWGATGFPGRACRDPVRSYDKPVAPWCAPTMARGRGWRLRLGHHAGRRSEDGRLWKAGASTYRYWVALDHYNIKQLQQQTKS